MPSTLLPPEKQAAVDDLARAIREAVHLRMRCIDFDVKERRWSHNRAPFRLDRFVSSADGPIVLQLEDASLHYLWKIDEGQNRGEPTGLYYQAEAEGKTEKISAAASFVRSPSAISSSCATRWQSRRKRCSSASSTRVPRGP